MTDNTQPEALRLAQELDEVPETGADPDLIQECAAELRRQHTRIAELEAQLEAIGAGGVNGPLMGQPQAMPDLTALTERGAKAWTAVDAQALREGVASVAASAPAPSGHIKEPYTVAEIKAKIASNDYSAEMLLQHAMLLLDSVQEDAARYRFLRDGEWRDTDLEPFIRLQLNTLWDAKIDAARAAQGRQGCVIQQGFWRAF